jgi:hypothetical protein
VAAPRTDGGRAVAEATLTLLATFPPFSALPATLVRRATTCLMEPHLLRALGYPDPTRVERATARAGMRVRALVDGSVADLPEVRSYPDGFDLARLGTFG